ncbi:hypothetical protein AVEN_139129-1 [Araneus ventricosus]|uniref:Uncharacterized protein n=2 Tax=Araneus ventricosus TaxID=182803 RepID=A0A4Y2FIN8_ARAVE|nr:hypothetical protein AVEN_139129-1 [Araneus ventricosus]
MKFESKFPGGRKETQNIISWKHLHLSSNSQHKNHRNRSTCHAVRPISVHQCRRDCRKRAESACDSHLSARRHHCGNAASPGSFSSTGTDDCRWVIATRPSSPSCGASRITIAKAVTAERYLTIPSIVPFLLPVITIRWHQRLKHLSYCETYFSTPMSEISASGEQSRLVTAVCVHVVVTDEMLLRYQSLQVL